MNMFQRIYCCVLFAVLCKVSHGQTINNNQNDDVNRLRAEQLMGKTNADISFTLRPIYIASLTKDSNSALASFSDYTAKRNMGILPVAITQQYNTGYPFGWNNSALIPAKGYQALIATGVYLKYNILDIKINPELVWAQNLSFDTLNLKNFSADQLALWYTYLNKIDNPERYGNGPYKKLGWGESHIALTIKGISLNLSNENLWWGPGIQNSLIMSNNAPGFKHLSVNTTHPLKSGIGTFEFQLMSGLLEPSGYPPYDPHIVYAGSPIYVPKPVDKAYFNGLILTYQPKWIKGLSIGAIRGYNQNWSDVKKAHAYLPVFANLFRSNDKGNNDTLALYSDEIASVFFRYLLPKAHFEIYAEFGREDASYNLRDLIMTPEHSGAFLFGVQKAYLLNRKEDFIQVQVEVTQLLQSADYLVRPAGPWYVHYAVTQGLTNNGKVLGAGIGPGSNSINFSMKWHKDNSIFGINLMQIERNNDMYNILYPQNKNRQWIDYALELNSTFLATTNKNIYFNLNADYVLSKNSNWLLTYYAANQNVTTKYTNNIQIKFSMICRIL